jgi:hypothetical protein
MGKWANEQMGNYTLRSTLYDNNGITLNLNDKVILSGREGREGRFFLSLPSFSSAEWAI